MHGTVIHSEQLTSTLVRVVLGGPGLAGFEAGPHTDAYINVAIPPDGAPNAAPFDLDEVRQPLPKEHRPRRRRYTVRSWDPQARRLTVDFVVHGETGVGGRWALAARPGDALVFTGPGGAYRPDPEADWHLMVGDESALPAIAASLEQVPAGAPVVARLLVDGPHDELELSSPGRADIGWVHRNGELGGASLLADAVGALPVLPGRGQAFVHGEAEEIRPVRRHLLADRGLAPQDLSCSPYWARPMTDEDWRQVKSAWVAEVERDVA